MNLEGKMLGGRYEIIEKIGAGGMATVYKAKCHVLNRYVAIKVLRDEFTTDSEFIKRFEIEAQSAASLTHPNIVSIYDVGNEGDLHFIVMELIQGKTLKEIIVEDGVLPWKWSVNIAMQIASALEVAHRNSIVHRDIKPHNIIITEDGMAKVTDFGIAKAVSNSTITAFGTTIGSVHYFSPEHARGGYTDAKSDLYSLGVVMYEMVTGKVPFDADTPVSIALKHMQEKPVEPIKVNPSVPFAVNKIIMKAMQKEASLRYSSATEMIRDLSLALKNPDGEFVLTRNIENDYPTQKIPTISGKNLEKKEEEKQEQKRKGKFRTFLDNHKGIKILLILFVCLAIFLVSLFGTFFVIEAKRPKEVQIPNLVDLTEEQAKQKLEEIQVQYKVKEEKYSTEVEAGKIISQQPPFKENYHIREKSAIEVVVSKGTEMTKVPKVAGMEKEEAVQTLKDFKLEAEVIEEKSSKVEKGYIIKQEMREDTEIEAGTVVKIYVSIGRGIEEVTVPNLIGETEAEAKKKIEEAKLKLTTVVEQEDKTKPDGTVLKQSIDPSATVDEGTGITITVNKIAKMVDGKITVDVKSFTGGIPKVVGNEILTDKEKKARVMITINDKTWCNEDVARDEQKFVVNFQGIGTVTVVLSIDNTVRKQVQLNLDENSTYTFKDN